MRLILALLMAMALSACAFDGNTAVNSAATVADAVHAPPPATLADRTVMDEQGMQALELAYKAARLAVETMVDTGLLHGSAASRFAELDNKAFVAVSGLRHVYASGNAHSYAEALTNARAAISAMFTLTGKGS